MVGAAPKVFISYSWTSKTTVGKVYELATRLREHGVDVILDKWCLKEGQDKYTFMEQMVKDETIDKVLIMCDESYAVKADDRKGGVGDETVIITPEVYGSAKQDKFIPIILEKSDDGTPFRPIYLKSRIYFDLSNEETYEAEYERILRSLHKMPEHKMPPLGNIPEWLKDDTTNIGPITRLCKAVSGLINPDDRKLKIYSMQMSDQYRGLLREFIAHTPISNVDTMITTIEKFLPLRNAYVDIFRTLCEAGMMDIHFFAIDFVCDCQAAFYNAAPDSFTAEMSEAIDYMLWEMVLCITAILFHYQLYSTIYCFVTGTFFLKPEGQKQGATEPVNITRLRPYLQIFDVTYARKINEGNKFSKAADILVQREYLPLITKRSLVLADLLLRQVFSSLEISSWFDYWFPMLYPYTEDLPEFKKCISKRYCEQIMPIVGAKTIDDFKVALERPIGKEPAMRYENDHFRSARRIIDLVPLDKIASMP